MRYVYGLIIVNLSIFRTVRLFEDSKSKGSVHIQGLEEVIVHNKHEVYTIMERGSQMRKTASTLLNANSRLSKLNSKPECFILFRK